ncbi:DsbA family protein [Janibacter sp. GXQ6167]|uniref:DsbA family protein n=1 Tax=Janibacter sp. GXQ6167 TaxID=3240791 RepID=UPI0035243AD4
MAPQNDRKAKIAAAAPKNSGSANKIVVAGIVAIVAVIAVVAAVIFQQVSANNKVEEAKNVAQVDRVPEGTKDGEGWVSNSDVNLANGAPTIDVYEDFRCPVCAVFERALGHELETLAADGKIKLVYHLKTVIDTNTNSDNSAVSASSALCAADQGAWTKYHEELFARQPQEPNPFTDDALTEAAKGAGLEGEKLDAWQKCTNERTYVKYVQSVDEASFKAGVRGTPAIKVNGTELNWGTFVNQDGSANEAQLPVFEQIVTSGDVPADRVAPKR